MDYSTEKYNSLMFETQRNGFDKDIKSDKIYTALETLRNLSYYNRLLETPEDIDIVFHTFSNLFSPVITRGIQTSGHTGTHAGVPLVPPEVLSAIVIEPDGSTIMTKVIPGIQYNAVGIFVPYNQFLLNAFDPVKSVPIDFRSGTTHKLYRGGNSRGETPGAHGGVHSTTTHNTPAMNAHGGNTWSSTWGGVSTTRGSTWKNHRAVPLDDHKDSYGGDSKSRAVKREAARLGGEASLKATKPKILKSAKGSKSEPVDAVEPPQENTHGRFIYFSQSDDPFGDAIAVLASIEARNVSWINDPVVPRSRHSSTLVPKTVPSEYKGIKTIPTKVLEIAKNILGIKVYSSWEDLATRLKQANKFVEFFQNINGIPVPQRATVIGTNLNYDNYFKERLLKQRKAMTRNEQELNELYRKDDLAGNPLFAELNKYIIAIKGRRLNFLKARPTEFDELLCQHYIDMKNHLLLVPPDTPEDSTEGNWMNKIVEKYGDSLDRTDGVYCSVCGEVIVLEHNFLSFGDSGSSNPTSVVPREIADLYYEDAYRLLNTFMLTEMNVKTLVDNIIVRIYPLILEAIEDFPEDKAGVDAHITMYYMAALASLSILEPEIIAFKSFRDGSKKLSGNAAMQQKLIVNEAMAIMVASKKSAIKASVFQSESSYKFKMDTEAFPKVHTLFSSLSSGSGVTQDGSHGEIQKVSASDLDGYNMYAAAKKMDNIIGGDGTLLAIVHSNFEKTGSVSPQALFKGIWPEPTALPKGKASLLYDSNGVFKNKNIRELLTPEVPTENQKHALFAKRGISWALPEGQTSPSPMYNFKTWYLNRMITSAVTVSNMSHISSYGIIKDKKPEVYFCLDYGDHEWETSGKVPSCSICGFKKGTKEVKADPKLSRMREFFNIYSTTCPESGSVDEPDESLIGDSKRPKTKRSSTKGASGTSGVSRFHMFDHGKCTKCTYSATMDIKSRIKFFEKYKKLLLEQRVETKDHTESPKLRQIPQGSIDKRVFKRMDQALDGVVKTFKIKSRAKIDALLDKNVGQLNSILISYFNYNGELYYYPDSDEDKSLYAKVMILEGMVKNKQRGDAFLKDEAMLGLVVIDNPDGITGGEEADDVTLENGEDEIEDESEDIFDLALDEEDRFDQADAE